MQASGLSPQAGLPPPPPPVGREVGLWVGTTVTTVVRTGPVGPRVAVTRVEPGLAHRFLVQVNWPSQSFSVWQGSFRQWPSHSQLWPPPAGGLAVVVGRLDDAVTKTVVVSRRPVLVVGRDGGCVWPPPLPEAAQRELRQM